MDNSELPTEIKSDEESALRSTSRQRNHSGFRGVNHHDPQPDPPRFKRNELGFSCSLARSLPVIYDVNWFCMDTHWLNSNLGVVDSKILGPQIDAGSGTEPMPCIIGWTMFS